MQAWISNFRRVHFYATLCLISLTVGACNSNNSPESVNVSPEAKEVKAEQQDSAKKIAVTVTDKGCEAGQITADAGKTIFVISNKSSNPLEFEILSGVKVIGERENIAPGFVQQMKSNLTEGEYDLVCGKLSTPKSKLIVKAASGTDQAKAPDSSQLAAPIAEYKVYVIQETDQLVKNTKTFTDAVIAGDLTKAQKLYAPARVHWERTEPVAELFSDLDNRMDARADDFEKKEADPKFTGFHRLEKALFQDKTTKGTKPIAEKLMKDSLELQKRVASLTIEPKNMVGGAADLIEEVAKTKISGEEDRYSHTDLWDFNSNVEGSQKIVELLRPLIQKANPDLLKRIDDNFTTVNQGLTKYKTTDGGFVAYEKVSETDKKGLKTSVTTLAEDLSQLRGTLGVD
jgi:iron uptake system component EfeO